MSSQDYQKKMVQVANHQLTAEALNCCKSPEKSHWLPGLAGYLKDRRINQAGLTAAEFAALYDFLRELSGAEQLPEPVQVPPVQWQLATWQEQQQYHGHRHYYSARESSQMLRKALAGQWPGVKFKVSTSRYDVTTVSYQEAGGPNFWHVHELGERFCGSQSAAPMDGRVSAYHWRPEPDGTRQLVLHGLGSVHVQLLGNRGQELNKQVPKPKTPLFPLKPNANA